MVVAGPCMLCRGEAMPQTSRGRMVREVTEVHEPGAMAFAYKAGETAGIMLGLLPPTTMMIVAWLGGTAPWWAVAGALLAFGFMVWRSYHTARFADVRSYRRSKWARRWAVGIVLAIAIADAARRAFA